MTCILLHLALRMGLFMSGLLALVLVSIGSPGRPTLLGITEFAVCDLPCWAGITPLETRFEASAQVMDSSLSHRSLDFRANNAQISFYTTEGIPQIDGVIFGERELVHTLRLEVSLPLWMLLEVLGSPTCARTERLSNVEKETMSLYWEMGTHTVTALLFLDKGQGWHPGVPTRYLFTGASAEDCQHALRWQGFAPVWHYRRW